MRKLVLDTLLPVAQRGLQSLNIPQTEIDEFLGIIDARSLVRRLARPVSDNRTVQVGRCSVYSSMGYRMA